MVRERSQLNESNIERLHQIYHESMTRLQPLLDKQVVLTKNGNLNTGALFKKSGMLVIGLLLLAGAITTLTFPDRWVWYLGGGFLLGASWVVGNWVITIPLQKPNKTRCSNRSQKACLTMIYPRISQSITNNPQHDPTELLQHTVEVVTN